jgi:hypothetical protein
MDNPHEPRRLRSIRQLLISRVIGDVDSDVWPLECPIPEEERAQRSEEIENPI